MEGDPVTTNPFNLMRSQCGLTQSEAMLFLSVSYSTIKSWDSGRRNPRQSVLDELRALNDKIQRVADHAIEVINATNPSEVELAYCENDADAQSLGLPFANCHNRALAEVIANIEQEVILAPRSKSVAALDH